MAKLVLPLMLTAPATTLAQTARTGTAPYHTQQQLASALDSIVRGKPTLFQLTELTKSAGGRAIPMIRVGAGTNVDARPAVLLIANAHGPHVVGTEIALRTLRDFSLKFGSDTAVTSLLNRNTVYVVPRLNPDAAEAFFQSPLYERTRNDLKYDDDKDGRVDEDGPADMNGDGVITLMRITDPTGTWIADSIDPALLRRADSRKGEAGKYRVIVEGRDTDKDGVVGEDPIGGIDINRNFANEFEFFKEGGDFPFASDEARAIAELFQAKQGIAAVYVIGPQDNLVRPWEGRVVPGIGGNPQGTSAGGPLTAILPGDSPWFAEMGRRFRTSTGFTRVPPAADAKGDVLSWVYYHMGRFAFGSRGWWVPDAPADTARSRRVDTPDAIGEERNAYRWLRANAPDQIVEWKAIQHPDFPGKVVEVGGIKPFALLNPPAAQLDAVTAKHSTFVQGLVAALPRLSLREIRVEAAGDRVFRVTAQIANNGYLPTNAAIGAQVRWSPRVRVDLVLGKDQSIVSGRNMQLLTNIDGSGGSTELSWLVVGAPGSTVTLKAETPMAGAVSETITLRARP
ncbi:MAG: M14 family metallopeptidase [Gemmatimonas sp.]